MSLPNNIKEQAIKTFNKYDFDKSGYIDFKELTKLMNDVSDEIAIPRPGEDDLKAVLQDTDSNGDKKIQLDEFLELFKIIYIMKNQE